MIVNKAQFGTSVWLNGKKLGEHWGCYTARRFDATDVMNWDGKNSLMIRVGAHPGVVPRSVPVVNDGEKEAWTPGIYDSVSLVLANDPVIRERPSVATNRQARYRRKRGLRTEALRGWLNSAIA